jgi:hypothetical protein
MPALIALLVLRAYADACEEGRPFSDIMQRDTLKECE